MDMNNVEAKVVEKGNREKEAELKDCDVLEKSKILEKEDELKDRDDLEKCKILEKEDELKDRDDLEKSRILALRSVVELEEPSFKNVDDMTLRRFLRARNLDVEMASKLFLKYLRWRQSFVPNGLIDVSEIPNNLAQNNFFVQGVDKQGHPIGIILARRHKQTSVDEFKRFAVFCLDKMCDSISKGQEKFVCIADLEGWGYANCDIRAYSAALTLLQDWYPERLGKLFIVHSPSIFSAAWKLISQFMDNKTKKKVAFVDDKLLKKALLEDIDEDQLPEIYGGKMKLVPIHEI